MSDSATSVFDMEAFRKRIEENVISNMGAMLPEEQLTAMVKQAIDKFFTQSEHITVSQIHHSFGYIHPDNAKAKASLKVSPFEYIVFSKLQPLVSQSVDRFFEEHRESLLKDLVECLKGDTENQSGMALSMTMLAERQQRLQLGQALMLANNDLRNDIRNRLGQAGYILNF